MSLIVKDFSLYRIELTTRMPFKYGIATMTDLPHVILRVAVDTGSRVTQGWSGDCLPPKWFTKDAEKDPREEIDEMVEVIVNAADIGAGWKAASLFDLWFQMYEGQMEWGQGGGLPPLLTHFGVSLMERGRRRGVSRRWAPVPRAPAPERVSNRPCQAASRVGWYAAVRLPAERTAVPGRMQAYGGIG